MYLENIYKPLNAIISASSDWILMIYSSLDPSHRDESNECKIMPIGAIFAKLAIFAKFRVGSDRVKLSDPTRYFGSVRVGYPDHGSKFGALIILSFYMIANQFNL